MNTMYDILLRRPMPPEALRALLFVTFTLHLLFVLFTIGTAILVVFYFVRAQTGHADSRAWVHSMLDAFLAHKSLAVVLGVAPLLLIQVGLTIPFFTAVNLFAPFWLFIILCLILSFLLLDSIGRVFTGRAPVRAWPALALGLGLAVVGLALLLVIPGVFVAVLTTTENSGQWVSIMQNNYRLTAPLAAHWLPRYLHVLAAGIVFAGIFHYFVARDDEAVRRRALLRWVAGGVLAQMVIGLALYLSLPVPADLVTNAVLSVAVLAAAALFLLTLGGALNLRLVAPLALFLLVGMLLTRQTLQDRAVLPLNEALNVNADAYRATISPQQTVALDLYQANLDIVYNSGATIYTQSCSFCHGLQGDGQGQAAAELAVQPEMIAAVRTTAPYLKARLLSGVNGSAMPYFSIYTADQLDGLMAYLNQQHQIFSAPQAVTVTVSATAEQQAGQTFASVCATCHGSDGAGNSPVALGLLPPPPDFRHFSLLPQRAFEVITGGYPGTAMAANNALPEDVRWGLVKHVIGLRVD